MPDKRTQLGRDIEESLKEVLAHKRGEITLPCRIVDDPSAAPNAAARRLILAAIRKG